MSKPVNFSSGVAESFPQVVNKKKKSNFWQDVFVGSISAMSAVPIIQPMDLL